MALPFIVRSGSLSRPWRSRAQLLINYFNKNFYQQLLFFILPGVLAQHDAGQPQRALRRAAGDVRRCSRRWT